MLCFHYFSFIFVVTLIQDLEKDLAKSREYVNILVRLRSDIESNVVEELKGRLDNAAIDAMFTGAAVQFGGILGYRETADFLENLAHRFEMSNGLEQVICDWQFLLVKRAERYEQIDASTNSRTPKFISSIEAFLLNENELLSLVCEQQLTETELRQILSLDICLRHSLVNWPLLLGPVSCARDLVNTWARVVCPWYFNNASAQIVEVSLLEFDHISLKDIYTGALEKHEHNSVVIFLITNFENIFDQPNSQAYDDAMKLTNRLVDSTNTNVFCVFQSELPFQVLSHWDRNCYLDRFCITTLNPFFDIYGDVRDLMANSARPELVTSRAVNSRELINQTISLKEIRKSTCRLIMEGPENLLGDIPILESILKSLQEIDYYCTQIGYFGTHRSEILIGELETPFIQASQQLSLMYNATIDASSVNPIVFVPIQHFFDAVRESVLELLSSDFRIPYAQLKQISMRIYRQVMCKLVGLLCSSLPDNLLRQTLTCMHGKALIPQNWLTNYSRRKKNDQFYPFTCELTKYRILMGFSEKLITEKIDCSISRSIPWLHHSVCYFIYLQMKTMHYLFSASFRSCNCYVDRQQCSKTLSVSLKE